jgi:hypothetical protein
VLEIACPEIQHVQEDAGTIERDRIDHNPASRCQSYSFQQFDMQSRPGAPFAAQVLVKPFLETESFE